MNKLGLGSNKTSILMLSVTLILFVSLVAYVTSLTPSFFDSAAGSDQLESEYIEKAKQTVLVLDSVAGDVRLLGEDAWIFGGTVGDVIEKIEKMKATVQKANSELDSARVPDRFAESHKHLVSATDRMVNSLESIEETFSKFERLDSKLPLYYVMSILNSDETTFYPLSQMFMLNETERTLIDEAKISFANAVIEADEVESERQMFVGLSKLSINSTSQGANFYESYQAMPGGCAACRSPINDLLKLNNT